MTTARRSGMWADPRYAHRVRKWEALSGAVTPDLIEALAPQRGERLLDVGCGTGAATFPAAALVGPDGLVVGADVSPEVVRFAEERAARTGAANVAFQVGDMQTALVASGPFDAVMSQFGVMFFDDPVAGFANLRSHLRPGGRLCFACWQPAGGNPWSYAALIADLLPDAGADQPRPGPFSLAQAADVAAMLGRAGFDGVRVTHHRAHVTVEREAIVDDPELALMGVPPNRMDEAWERVRRHLAAFRTAPRTFRLPIAYLIATAVNDGRRLGVNRHIRRQPRLLKHPLDVPLQCVIRPVPQA